MYIPHILVVDDDVRIVKLLKQFLCQNGFIVSTSPSAQKAMQMLQIFTYDLIILDVMMPKVTGTALVQELRKQRFNIPVILLTALSETEDKIQGLEAGASDYVTKPFDPRELLLRANNLINMHKQQKQEASLIRFGANIFDTKTKTLMQNDVEIKLSSTEEMLLEALILANNSVVTRDELAKILGNVNPRSVDVQIVRLRNKIESYTKAPQFLKTIRHKGYVLYHI